MDMEYFPVDTHPPYFHERTESMIIATVCMMRNEEIMAESAIRYWLGFSDFVIVFDHNSTDGTPDILSALRKEFEKRLIPFELHSPVGIEKIQKRITNEMIRLAINEYGADLVVPLDTDEFPFTPNRKKESVRDVLESLKLDCCYKIDRIPYVLAHDDDFDTSRFIPLSFTQTRKPLFFQIPKMIIAKTAYQSDPVCVRMGNHSFFRPSGNELPPVVKLGPELRYAHYPYQGLAHFKVKNALGWMASHSNPDWKPGMSYHSQRCTERLLSGENITEDFVKWAIFTDFWATGESLSDIQFEIIDPLELFPEIPLLYTNRYARKKDSFALLLEQSLRLVEQYKTKQKDLADQSKELERTKRKLAVTESSLSYRLGRALTWLPRKLSEVRGETRS
jgi:hypothetical protein